MWLLIHAGIKIIPPFVITEVGVHVELRLWTSNHVLKTFVVMIYWQSVQRWHPLWDDQITVDSIHCLSRAKLAPLMASISMLLQWRYGSFSLNSRYAKHGLFRQALRYRSSLSSLYYRSWQWTHKRHPIPHNLKNKFRTKSEGPTL